MDVFTIPILEHPLIRDVHYISYNPGTKKGLDGLISTIEYYLNYENGTDDIGRDFVLKHHRSVNRIDNILSIISPEHVMDP